MNKKKVLELWTEHKNIYVHIYCGSSRRGESNKKIWMIFDHKLCVMSWETENTEKC